MMYFSDLFGVSPKSIEDYGAFNISLVNDLPLFIDPFLLFGSDKNEYMILHEGIIKYLSFLKKKSDSGKVSDAQIKSWYKFSEVKQNWFGYSLIGNSGSGLGLKFGRSMSEFMHIIFHDINNEEITATSHLEKAGLFRIGVGRDNISDFTCNLIKEFLCRFTEKFALQYIDSKYLKTINVDKVYFDYEIEKWMSRSYTLPVIKGDFVVLTPKDLLTKDDTWINSRDLRHRFTGICSSIPNDQLRSEINNFYKNKLPSPSRVIRGRKKPPTNEEVTKAINQTIQQFPSILDYYIKQKESDKKGAKNISQQNVELIQSLFVKNVATLIKLLLNKSKFYAIAPQDSFTQSLNRILYLKQVIEKNDGWRLFYIDGKPIKRESDLQVIYRLTWFASPLDVNRETNNGRGSVDYAISNGSKDKTLIEFKLASNSKLKMNLANQVKIYEAANNTKQSIKAILFFTLTEKRKLQKLLSELKLSDQKDIVLIDAIPKHSASNVK